MKVSIVAAAWAALFIGGAAFAQKPAATPHANEFQAGKPLGTINDAGQFTSLTNNVKVYGSFRLAESCMLRSSRKQKQLVIPMNDNNAVAFIKLAD